jgi:hypothetical protein
MICSVSFDVVGGVWNVSTRLVLLIFIEFEILTGDDTSLICIGTFACFVGLGVGVVYVVVRYNAVGLL